VSLCYTGQSGKMEVGITGNTPKEVAKVTNWSLTANMSPIETTSLGDETRQLCPGVRSYSGTCRVLYHRKDGNWGVANVLETIMRGDETRGTQVCKFKFVVNPTVGDRIELGIDAYITSAALAVGVGEVLAADISFEGFGDLTQVTLG